MNSQQKKDLDEQLKNFKSFMEFHRYAFEHDIYFDNFWATSPLTSMGK